MEYPGDVEGREQDIATLFTETFAASEGADEGRLIGTLALRLIETTPAEDLHVVTAVDTGGLAGCILFTRLRYDDPRAVFLLAPVAVATARQGQGIGQGLIAHGLDRLRTAGADVAVTYGDPAFYGRIGFRPVTEAVVPAPLPLSMPRGWQAQSLTGRPLDPLRGPATCVPAFADPALW